MEGFADPLRDHIAVYVPQSFQVAGFTFLAPKEDIEILNVKAEEAMKFILSGGVTGKNDSKNK